MYNYEEERPKIFTENGTKILTRVILKISELSKNGQEIFKSGEILVGNASTWEIQACLDYLSELGIIALLSRGEYMQYNKYVIVSLSHRMVK